MAKTIIKQITNALPQLLQLSNKQQSWTMDFDKKADVLYINFAAPQEATDTQIVSDDILLRKKDGRVIGVTIMHASNYR